MKIVAAALLALLPALMGLPDGTWAQPTDQAGIQEHAADGARLTMEVDRTEIAIDGRIRVVLQLDVPSDRLAALPELPERFGPFAVVVQSPAESKSNEQGVRLRRHYELEPEGVGELVLPPLVVAVRDQGGDAAIAEIRTDPVTVVVASVVPEGVDYTEPKDIAPPLSLPRPGWPIEVWLGLAAVAAAVVAGLLAWQRRRSRAPSAVPQPAHVLALAELDRLQRAAQGGEERVEAFYVRLSAILRRYLGWRFGLRALMQTTDEFVAGLPRAESGLAPYRPVLATLLASFDLVKFARYRPTRSDMEEALRRVREFVERTGDERVLIDPTAAQTP